MVVCVVAPCGSCRWPMALGPRDSGLRNGQQSGQVPIAQITVRGGKYNIPGIGPECQIVEASGASGPQPEWRLGDLGGGQMARARGP